MSFFYAVIANQGGGPEVTSGFSDGVGSATGQATVSGVGAKIAAAAGTSAGQATATADGNFFGVIPRAHWAFNETVGGTAPDIGTASHPGTLINAPAWVAGQLGNALDFESSSSQRVDFTAGVFSANTVQAFTLCAWIKPESCGTNGGGNIISWTNAAGNGSNLQLRLSE